MKLPFGGTKVLEAQVDSFLDLIAKGALGLGEGVKAYLAGELADFEERIGMVSDLEGQADDVGVHIETVLYTHSLIPESRGDVLRLLGRLDDLIDHSKAVLQHFDVERPEIPDDYVLLYRDLTAKSVQAVEHVVLASRAYFRDLHLVKDHINKVDFYESEADRAALKLKKRIFRSDLPLSSKQHLRYFAEAIEDLSDLAWDVAQLLAIAAIKRMI